MKPAVLLFIAVLASEAQGQAINSAPLRSGEVSFAMRATKVNDFTGHAPVTAQFSGSDLTNVTGTVEIRVDQMRTGIGLRDTHMRNAMQADRFPTISFQLVGVDAGTMRGDTIPLTYQGHLSIRGITHTVRVPGWAVVRPGNIEIYASIPVDMREYGVDPPSRFLGAIKVDPVTQVTVRLTFGS